MNESILKNILLYVESSESSLYSAEYAITLAHITGAQLTALYVIDLKTLEELLRARIFIKSEELEYERDLEEDGKRYLMQVKEMAMSRNVAVSTILAKGEVHTTVLQHADKIDADLVVIAAIAEMKSRKDAFFDEGERIAREAPCPVVIAHGPKKITQLYKSIQNIKGGHTVSP